MVCTFVALIATQSLQYNNKPQTLNHLPERDS